MEQAWSTLMVWRNNGFSFLQLFQYAYTKPVEFRMIVFRPFKGEVMLGRIRSSTPSGIHLRTDFFDDIFVPYEELPQGAE